MILKKSILAIAIPVLMLFVSPQVYSYAGGIPALNTELEQLRAHFLNEVARLDENTNTVTGDLTATSVLLTSTQSALAALTIEHGLTKASLESTQAMLDETTGQSESTWAAVLNWDTWSIGVEANQATVDAEIDDLSDMTFFAFMQNLVSARTEALMLARFASGLVLEGDAAWAVVAECEAISVEIGEFRDNPLIQTFPYELHMDEIVAESNDHCAALHNELRDFDEIKVESTTGLGAVINKLETVMETIRDKSQLSSILLQNYQQKESQFFTILSNVMKSIKETTETIIRNMK
jgi:hypothetical protein